MTKEIRLIIIHYVPQLLGFLCLLIPMAVTGNIGIELIALSFFFSGFGSLNTLLNRMTGFPKTPSKEESDLLRRCHYRAICSVSLFTILSFIYYMVALESTATDVVMPWYFRFVFVAFCLCYLYILLLLYFSLLIPATLMAYFLVGQNTQKVVQVSFYLGMVLVAVAISYLHPYSDFPGLSNKISAESYVEGVQFLVWLLFGVYSVYLTHIIDSVRIFFRERRKNSQGEGIKLYKRKDIVLTVIFTVLLTSLVAAAFYWHIGNCE